MTKVWEETWTGGIGDEPDISGPNGVYGYFDSRGDDDNIETDVARARLAACAPAAIRLLERLETVSHRGFPECPTCGAAWAGGDVPHEEDCAWLALMKKAGVR